MSLDLTSEHLAWLRAGYRVWRKPELTERINERFGLDLTTGQVRNIIHRHRMASGRPRGLRPGERRPLWTDPMVDWLRAHRAEATLPEIGQRFRALFGAEWTDAKINSACKRYGIAGGRDGRFRPQQTPWNKGLAGYKAGGRSAETRFKDGTDPWTTQPIGAYRSDSDGMWWVKVRDDSPVGFSRHDWCQVQRLTYQDYRGPIPEGHVVVFVDGDPGNCLDPANLETIDRATLLRLNQMGWGQLRDPELRRAALNRARLFTRAHQVGDAAGIPAQARREMIGTLGPFVRRQSRAQD